MSDRDDHRDHAKEAVSAIMCGRGLSNYEIVARCPLLDHPAGNEAVLVRFPDAAPEILVVRIERRDRRQADRAESILREAGERYAHASRSTTELLKRYENERDRTTIEDTLKALAAREIDAGQAMQALGLPSMIQLVLLQQEFRIAGPPGMVDMSVDAMQDIVREKAEDWKARGQGIVPASDYARIRDLRKMGSGDGAIRGHLGIREDAVLPTDVEIGRYEDSLVYGIEPDAPPAGVTVTVTLGTKNAKVRIVGTDGVETVKVANPRYAGRNLAGYVDEALDRMHRDGSLPEPRKW